MWKQVNTGVICSLLVSADPKWTKSAMAGFTSLISSFSPTETVARLSYVATLEDLGLVRAREVIVSESSQVRRVGGADVVVFSSPSSGSLEDHLRQPSWSFTFT